MQFQLISQKPKVFNEEIKDVVHLYIDKWNDYNYVTMFYMTVFDSSGKHHEIGNIKIGFQGQQTKISSHKKISSLSTSESFTSLPEEFFSLGQDVDYYINLQKLPDSIKNRILINLNDVVYNQELFERFKNENVMSTSLMRGINTQRITDQFRRVLEGKSPLTNFKFSFVREEQEEIGHIQLDFDVIANSIPSTNIHAIIGRNGVGKTTLLHGMIGAFTGIQNNEKGAFYKECPFYKEPKRVSNEYFGHLIAVSFSVFDPFVPNQEELRNYSYIGLKKSNSQLKSAEDYFRNDFLDSFKICHSNWAKKERWLNAIRNLESDENFSSMNLSSFMENELDDTLDKKIFKTISKMSSGHAAVLLITTQLVAKVEEKTLVLLDEPESHLHPPLLSAFIRALSDLLDSRNGIAIIATHSPVVLQEIPKSCVWKIERTGKKTDAFRLNIETFGENVGLLTKEVFGLEVMKSGFYKLLDKLVNEGENYETIINKFENKLGTEARILLKILIQTRESKRKIQ